MTAPTFITHDRQLARTKLLDKLKEHTAVPVTVFFAEYGSASMYAGVESATIQDTLDSVDRAMAEGHYTRNQLKEALYDGMKANKQITDRETFTTLLVWVLCTVNPAVKEFAKTGGYIIGGTLYDRPAPDGGVFLGFRVTVEHQ